MDKHIMELSEAEKEAFLKIDFAAQDTMVAASFQHTRYQVRQPYNLKWNLQVLSKESERPLQVVIIDCISKAIRVKGSVHDLLEGDLQLQQGDHLHEVTRGRIVGISKDEIEIVLLLQSELGSGLVLVS